MRIGRFGILLVLVMLLAVSFTVQAQDEIPGEVMTLATDQNTFAFDLYGQIATDANLIFSPYSIAQALAMTYAGARGTTAEQMAATLHFSPPPESLHTAFNSLAAGLAQRAIGLDVMTGGQMEEYTLNIANALWGQDGFAFKPDFTGLLEQSYGAGLRLVDFVNAPSAARDTINDWVEEQTEDKIQDIVPEGVITPDTRLVLANAIYFLAAWRNPFFEGSTSEQDFTLLDGSTIQVPTMMQQEGFGYAQMDGYQVVELPYGSGNLSMVILLPDAGQFEAVRSALNAEAFAGALNTLHHQELILYLPRFSFEYTLPLTDTLQDMGMTDAFSDRADFSGIADEPLSISDVLHKAFIGVDENGTEAAAATVVIIGVTSAPVLEPVEVRIDRPFVYAIVDRPSGAILFMGQVTNPAAG